MPAGQDVAARLVRLEFSQMIAHEPSFRSLFHPTLVRSDGIGLNKAPVFVLRVFFSETAPASLENT